MASTVQPIAPIDQPVLALSNPVLSAMPAIVPLMITRADNLCIGRRTSDNALAYSSDEMATWTILANKPAEKPLAIIETYDGELLVLASNAANPNAAGVNVIYKSTGWTANKQTATFASKMTTGGTLAGVNAAWSFHGGCIIPPSSAFPNGVVVTNQYGGQTQPTGDKTLCAVYAYASFDHGNTWSVIFDLLNAGRANPVGVHLHGCCLSAQDNRMYISFGDGTGDGKLMPGAGNTQIAYVNLEDLTYGYMPIPALYTGFTGAESLQVTGIRCADDGSLITTPDARPYSILTWGRTGYRQFGNMHWTVPIGTGDARTIGTGVVQSRSGEPVFAAFQMEAGGQAANNVPAFYVALNGFDWQQLWSDPANPLGASEAVYLNVMGIFASKKFIGFYTNTKAGLGARMLTGTMTTV